MPRKIAKGRRKVKLISYREGAYPTQADPYIFQARDGYFYVYVTATEGVRAYRAATLTGEYEDMGYVFAIEGKRHYWAPSIIFTQGKYYMYVSCADETGNKFWQAMHVGSSDSPLGPFANFKQIIPAFSIDSHIVENESGLFLFYAVNECEGERPGTRVVVDRMITPEQPSGHPVTVVQPTLNEEISRPASSDAEKSWHTLEGPFYFREGEWQYVVYSGSAYERENYYLGYCAARTDERDLTKIKFQKYPDENTYSPLLLKNEYEEGTGHNSLIKVDGQWYVVYHGRDTKEETRWAGDKRTARICKLHVNGAQLTVERNENSL